MGNFLVRYASGVVIYDRRAIIRLATGCRGGGGVGQRSKEWLTSLYRKSVILYGGDSIIPLLISLFCLSQVHFCANLT